MATGHFPAGTASFVAFSRADGKRNRRCYGFILFRFRPSPPPPPRDFATASSSNARRRRRLACIRAAFDSSSQQLSSFDQPIIIASSRPRMQIINFSSPYSLGSDLMANCAQLKCWNLEDTFPCCSNSLKQHLALLLSAYGDRLLLPQPLTPRPPVAVLAYLDYRQS